MDPIAPPALQAITSARKRIAGAAVRTPLIRLDTPADRSRNAPALSQDSPSGVWLKLECLQPIGSFKIRGAANAMALATPEQLSQGVYTASAGNMAQGVAFAARRLRVACRVIVPNSAPQTKVDAIRRLGGVVVPLPFDEWWEVLRAHGHPDEKGFFIHPVSDPAVIAGNGTIGLELTDELHDIDSVFVPFGGGGLSCGIASALDSLRPETRVVACEVETSAPFAASIAAGRASAVERVPSFVDGIGGSSVLEEMWPLASQFLAGSVVMSIDDICQAIRMLAAHAHVVAEGAAACAVAAAVAHQEDHRDECVVAVVSGGNIDRHVLATILGGHRP
jgi:threonine dehydratase